jgi:hypothetical protein
MPLMKVISQTLKFISEKASEKLSEQVSKLVKAKVRWVLTVPALWSEEHKQFMRKACMEAGIIEDLSSQHLLLCLEPEGASIQCREDADEALRNELVKESVVMVLDCGGGTVDITIHKLKCNPDERFVCEELLPSDGGSEWGSKYVDKYFESFLEKLFGPELYEVYRKSEIQRLEILKHFEMLKRKFNPGVDERSRLQLSYMGEELSAGKLKELVAAFNGENNEQIKPRGASSIDLPPDLMKQFFLPLLDKIKGKVEELVQKVIEKND